MACEVPQRDWRGGITPRRVGFAVSGGMVILVAIILSADQAAYLLLAVGGLLLVAGFGVPVAAAAEIGGHPVGSLIALLSDRPRALATQIRGRMLARLTGVAGDVTLDDARAARLVEQAIEQAAARWRGPVSVELETYLLCYATQLALTDAWRDPPVGEDDPRLRLSRISRRDRAIWALRRFDVPDAVIARMLDCSTKELAAAIHPLPGDEP